MKYPTSHLVAAAVTLLTSLPISGAVEFEKLKVLYICDIETPRAADFADFFRKKIGKLEVASRKTFKAAGAGETDVVVLDWPQSAAARDERKNQSPLGERGSWTKPTVLLGSAGLNLAVVWKVRGGSG